MVLRSLAPLLLLMLFGCGWRLQGHVLLPPEGKRIAVLGLPANDPLCLQLQTVLQRAGGRMALEEAQVVLVIHRAHVRRRDLALDEHGRAIEYELFYEVDFEIQAPDRKVIWPRDRLVLSRVYLNPQLEVIGKAQEERQLREEMRREAARLLLDKVNLALSHAAETEPAP